MTTFAELNDLVIGSILTYPFGSGAIAAVEQHPEINITTITLEGGVFVSIPSDTEVPISVDIITEEEAAALEAFRSAVVASHAEGLIDDDDRRRLLSQGRVEHLVSWLRKR